MKETNYFSENLKFLRNKFKDTQSELSMFLNKKSLSSVSDWERGKSTPNAGTLSKIAERYHVSIDDLVDVNLKEETKKPNNVIRPNFTRIPLIGLIAGGDPILAEQNINEYIDTIDVELPKGELFYLKLKGSSMEPVIPNGSLVLCRQQEEVENGQIAAVLLNSDTEATLKRVRFINGMMILEPINTEYEPYIANENNPARIIGKAVKVSFNL